MRARWIDFKFRFMQSPRWNAFNFGLLIMDATFLFVRSFEFISGPSLPGLLLVVFWGVITALQTYNFGRSMKYIKLVVTPDGTVLREYGPFYPGHDFVEQYREYIEQIPSMTVNREPDFVEETGCTRERQPTDCPRCSRPLKKRTLGSTEYFELLECYGDKRIKLLPHYEWVMGEFRRDRVRVRRKIRLPKLAMPRLAWSPQGANG